MEIGVSPVKTSERQTGNAIRPEPMALAAFLTEVVLVMAPDGTVIAELGSPQGLLGHGERLGTGIADYAHPEDLPKLLDLGARAMAGGLGWQARFTGRLRRADGEWRRYEFCVVNRVDDPAIGGLVIRTSEIVDNNQAMEAEKTMNAGLAFESLTDAVPVAIVVLDWNGQVLFANRAAERVCGRTSQELRGNGLGSVTDDTGKQAVTAALEHLRRSPAHVTVSLSVLGGGDAPVRRVEARLDGQDGRDGLAGVLVTLVDVTDRHAAEKELRRLATQDPLTGVLNRTAIIEAIAESLIRAPEAVCIAYCDLDGFKEVNDDLGHQAGDEVLANFAETLGAATRPTDLVGRVGGDEFVVMLVGPIDPERFVRRVRRLGGKQYPSGWGKLRFSIGLAKGRPGDTATALLARADEAMYADKRRRLINRGEASA